MYYTTEELIQQALDRHIIDKVEDLPWYNVANGDYEDENRLYNWLEQQLNIERPTFTLPVSVLFSLINEQEFRVLLSKAAVSAIVEDHLKIVDEKIKERVSGNYTPELSAYFHSRLEPIIHNVVDNYLRNRAPEIQKWAHEAVDKNLENHVKSTVNVHLERMKKKILKDLGGE